MRIVAPIFLAGATAAASAPEVSPLPLARPWTISAQPSTQGVRIVGHDRGVVRSLRPVPRPWQPGQVTQAAQAKERKPLWIGGKGKLCGSRAIQGSRVNPVSGRLRGCGILNPVKITAVEGVRLSRPATVDCPTAQALAEWVRTGVKPAIGRRGGGLAVIEVIGSYSCRTRNSKPGAKLSEHGRGRAIDISGFRLANGERISVQDDWRKGPRRRILRKTHAVACGPFGTVLGPNADRYHQDHFHLDTANHSGGNYCR